MKEIFNLNTQRSLLFCNWSTVASPCFCALMQALWRNNVPVSSLFLFGSIHHLPIVHHKEEYIIAVYILGLFVLTRKDDWRWPAGNINVPYLDKSSYRDDLAFRHHACKPSGVNNPLI